MKYSVWTLILALGCGAGASYSADTASEAGAPGGGYARATASASVAAEPAPVQARAPVPSAGSAAVGSTAGGSTAPVAVGTVGGESVSVRTTTTVTVTVENPAPPPVEVAQYEPQARLLTAASVGDHDRRGNYLEFLSRHPHEARRIGLDMSRRIRFRVVDAQGMPVGDARVVLSSGRQGVVEGRTHADGRWDFFPGVSAPHLQSAEVHITAGNATARARLSIPHRGDGQDITLQLNGVQRQTPRVLDLAFLIDVTGSMEDELRYVNREVAEIVGRIGSEAPEVNVRVGAVFYRDRTDTVPLQRIAFTENVQGFAHAMRSIRASGGGDYPEDVNSGLQTAIQSLEWSEGNAARVLVLIADAPPKNYQTQYTYREAMIEAGSRGIRILPVAASGANREVELLFRAMGTFTSTPYVYLTDDSGIGNAHQEADTDRVAVEYFNDLLTRLMVSDVRGRGMHEPGNFGASS
ncbi:MAG: VWA domain-containing protein [Myxococcota bacterium]